MQLFFGLKKVLICCARKKSAVKRFYSISFQKLLNHFSLIVDKSFSNKGRFSEKKRVVFERPIKISNKRKKKVVLFPTSWLRKKLYFHPSSQKIACRYVVLHFMTKSVENLPHFVFLPFWKNIFSRLRNFQNMIIVASTFISKRLISQYKPLKFPFFLNIVDNQLVSNGWRVV